jgi:Met-zincin/Domain of unknown function (DUF5117)
MSRSRILLLVLLALQSTLVCATKPEPAGTKPTPTIRDFSGAMKRMDGFFPLFWDAKSGHLYLEAGTFDQDFLFLPSLPYGLGSNDIGLDRGTLGRGIVVHFSRVGPKILLVQPNLSFRSSGDQAERLAVTQSFAESVIAGFEIQAEENGAVLIDITPFCLSDRFGAARSLAESNQGDYKVDDKRSAIVLDNTKNFPLNTEMESLLTFATEKLPEKSQVGSVAPDAYSVTLREHYSFIQLPGSGYQPRAFDPRAGYFNLTYRDYSAPLGSPLEVRLIVRHRLEKKDPSAAVSEAVKPIVYYVDRGAPEPMRSALLEGANWWNEAFEAAGFKDAFHVELLPEGADVMDIRYNTIQWVHRSTRGWSYGVPVVDPRTGEIIKGQVTLGSLRARQDYLIAEALLSPYKDGATAPPELQQMVLARIRQLAAHEVGHTLGLAHNFAASSIAPGTSVMDYPHPWITLDNNGHPDLSHAYSVGIGAWDKVAIQYGYSQFPSGSDEHAALDSILSKAQADGLYFMSDADSRPAGSAHPYSHLWDNGPDPAAELDRILKVRSAALAQFGESAVKMGTPLAQLEDTLVPLYLLHRYETEAAAKELGGLNYRYALRGDRQVVAEIVDPADQQEALSALLKTISPDTLTIPESLLKIMPPRPPDFPRTKESFDAHTGLTFDPGGAAEAATEITLGLLFNPQRASRLLEYHLRNPQSPSLEQVIEAVIDGTWKAPRATGLQSSTQAITEMAVTEHLLQLAADKNASAEAQAVARAEAVGLLAFLSTASGNAEEQAVRAAAQARIELFLKQPDKFTPAPAPPVPPGQPIGEEDE